MKISIIVPIYNVEKFLERCLNSLINQTLKDIEIICINDGSTDKSLDILNKFAQKDSRIIVINQENGGSSLARNKGLDIAKGKYIGFVDSDDWIDENYFEKLYNTAEKYNADIAAAEIIKLDETRKRKLFTIKEETVITDFKEKCIALDIPSKAYVWNKIFLREKLNQNKFHFEAGMVYEDMIFTSQVLEKLEKVVTVPGVYYYYWKNKKSTVFQKTAKNKADYEKALRISSELLKRHNIIVGEEKIKLFGLTVFKKIRKINEIIYIIFNIIKIKKAI